MIRHDYSLGISREESNIISVIRVFAMFLIIGCHLSPIFSPIRQILVVGVDVFFIVSGFIYGQKEIKGARKWIKDRLVRILVPVYSFYIMAFTVLFFWGKIGNLKLTAVLLQLLNLNGFIDNVGIGNIYTAHLWYISFVLICYAITPILQKVRGVLSCKTILLLLIMMSVIECVIICNIRIQAFIIWTPGILAYISAYFFGAYWDKIIKKKHYMLFSIFMIFCMLARLYIKRLADIDEIFGIFYARVVVQYTHIVLAYWIFVTLYAVCKKFVGAVKNTKGFIMFFDNISFEIYIIHQVLCAGVLSVMKLTDNTMINVAVFTVTTIIASLVLNKISALIISAIGRDYKKWRKCYE